MADITTRASIAPYIVGPLPQRLLLPNVGSILAKHTRFTDLSRYSSSHEVIFHLLHTFVFRPHLLIGLHVFRL